MFVAASVALDPQKTMLQQTALQILFEFLSPLLLLTNLEGLDLNANMVSNLSPLADKTSLLTLLLGGNSVSDVTPILGLTQLDVLWLGNQEWPPGLSCAQQQAIVAALLSTEIQVDGFWDDPDDDPDEGNIDCFP